MKKTLQFSSFGIILILLFSACSIEKRRYMPGYNVQWNNSKPGTKGNEIVQNIKPAGGGKIVPVEQAAADNIIVDETAAASPGNSNTGAKRAEEKSKHHAAALTVECDVVTLKNGDEINARISGISKKEIKFKKCEEVNGPTYTLRKSEVFMIKFRDGTKTIFSADISTETKDKPAEKEDSGVFGILSFVSILAAILIFGFLVGHSAAEVIILASIILIPLAIIFGVIGVKKRRKNKGLAIIGLSLGIVAVLFAIIFSISLLLFYDPSCFSSGTKILMADKTEINIESIKQGDRVFTYDFKSNILVKTEVERLVTARHSNLFKLTFDEGEITVTDDHPFWVAAKGWASLNPGKSNNNYRQENSIDQLAIDDSLFLPSNNKLTKLQNIQPIEREQLMYTIELKEGNNFIANGLLVKTEQTIETKERLMLTLHGTNIKTK
jgi:ataxin-1/HBP1 module (AXH) protein